MNKLYYFIFILILGCSLNPNSTFWSKTQKIETDKIATKILFEDIKPNKNEFNPKLKINLPKQNVKNINSNFNNDGFTQIDINYENFSKYSLIVEPLVPVPDKRTIILALLSKIILNP